MSSRLPKIKKGQVYLLDERAAMELEKAVVKLNAAGYAIRSLYNVLVEIGINEDSDGSNLWHLKSCEKHNIQTAMALLGDLTVKETYRLAERFGLEEPC